MITPTFTNPMNTTIQMGTNFTCSANGYPPPYVVWVPLMSNLSISDGQRAYGNATLMPSTAGQASWNCTALSQQTGMVVAWSAVNFTGSFKTAFKCINLYFINKYIGITKIIK